MDKISSSLHRSVAQAVMAGGRVRRAAAAYRIVLRRPCEGRQGVVAAATRRNDRIALRIVVAHQDVTVAVSTDAPDVAATREAAPK